MNNHRMNGDGLKRRILDRISPSSQHARSNPCEVFPVDAWTDPGYADWFDKRRRQLYEQCIREREEDLFDWRNGPIFSIIVPLFKTKDDDLIDAIESVLSQIYPRFELILVNGSKDIESINFIIESFAHDDPRIKVMMLEENKGITLNTVEGILSSSGDFICFLDHDDMLDPCAFWLYAKAYAHDPQIDIFYSDEDMIEATDAQSSRLKKRDCDSEKTNLRESLLHRSARKVIHKNPVFKPDFSPELLLSKNYIVHFVAIRRDILQEILPMYSYLDGAQDFYEISKSTGLSQNVLHVPEVLYHWRISDLSTATNPGSKPYTTLATKKVLQQIAIDKSIKATFFNSGIKALFNHWFEVSDDKLISIIVTTSDNSSDDLDSKFRDFVDGFEAVNTYTNIEIIKCSPGKDGLDAFNDGAMQATGDFLLFMDAESSFESAEPLEQLLGLLMIDGVGAVAPKLLYDNMRISTYGIAVNKEGVFPLNRGHERDFPGYLCLMRAFINTSGLPANGLMISRKIFTELGGFDDEMGGFLGAVSLGLKIIESGKRLVQSPTVNCVIGHDDPGSVDGVFDSRIGYLPYNDEQLAAFDKKWAQRRRDGDPYYNPNLDQRTGYYQCNI